MKNTKVYVDFITEKLKKLLSIDSPTGYTKDAIAWLKAEYEAMGYAPVITTKGGLLVQLAKGCEGNGGVLVETHTDTLGGMVAEVKGNGRLRLTALGGMNPNNAETENCVVITRDGKRARIRANDLDLVPGGKLVAQRERGQSVRRAVRHDGADLPVADIAGAFRILPRLAEEEARAVAPVRDMLHLIAPDRVDRLPGGGLEISNKTNAKLYTEEDNSDKAADRKRLMNLRLATLDKDNTDSLPKLMSSDAHTIAKLGKNIDDEAKLTRLKMDDLTFDSFRIALLSGSSRVRIESDLPEVVPCFETLTIEGGLLDKQIINFSKNLTCIIGGRGTGKSTLLECVRAGANAHTEASVINTEVWPDVLTLSYIDEQGTKHSFRREKNMETVNLVPDDIDRCPLEWYGQGETAMTIKKSEESPIHLLNFLNNFVDLSALNMRDEELREQLRDNQSELTRLRLDIKQKEEVKKIKSNFDAQLNHLQKDKVKDLVNFNLSLAKEREIRKSVINELNELVKKYGAILSDKSFFEWFTSLDTKDIIIGSEYIEQVKGIVDQFAKIVATKHTELIEELKLKINDLKLSIDNWKVKDTEYQQKIDAKREELETKGIPFDLGKINKIINDSMTYAKKLKEIEDKEKILKEKLKERRELVKERISISSTRKMTHDVFATTISNSLKNNVDEFFITLKYAEGKYTTTFRDLLLGITQWRKTKLDAILKNVTPLKLAEFAIKKDFSFMDNLKDENGNSVFSQEDKNVFLAKCLENYRYEEFESEFFDDLPTITVAKKITDDTGVERYITRSLYQLSMGQQQSILLAILLQSDSKKPLLIDQPEDNLDSEFIYKSIVRNLRRIKEYRQVIIVTHNANIAVLGDAELIIPLKSTHSNSMIMDRGSIDNEKTKVLCCEILEGGKRAFKKRQEIYNI